MKAIKNHLFEGIETLIHHVKPEDITENRKAALQPLASYIQSKVEKRQPIRLNFICTHNSRRSHFSQVWAQTLAYYYNIKNVTCYSGGTESTAVYPMVIESLKSSGFKIQKLSKGNNPIYSIKYSENEHPILCFSKKLDDDFNPISSFAAILTCNSAKEACPTVYGEEIRIPIVYEDPKAYDNTPEQKMKYMERNLQIATELVYVFSKASTNRLP